MVVSVFFLFRPYNIPDWRLCAINISIYAHTPLCQWVFLTHVANEYAEEEEDEEEEEEDFVKEEGKETKGTKNIIINDEEEVDDEDEDDPAYDASSKL